jgi:citrate lyase subunit beta/citryl-CoA lyase
MLSRSYLFMPGNNQKLLSKAGQVEADAVIFDLEDAVPAAEKDRARRLIHEALESLPGKHPLIYVRVNNLSPACLEADIQETMHRALAGYVIPKVTAGEQVKAVEFLCARFAGAAGSDLNRLSIQVMIESARGVIDADRIAQSSPRIEALAFGAEDFTHDIGAVRTAEGWELFQARSQIVMAAKANRLMAVDAVFGDLSDAAGFAREVAVACKLGFDGKQAIHPKQLPLINETFAPGEDEVKFARKAVAAYREAMLINAGVVLVDGYMVDLPVFKKAERVLSLIGEI